MAEPLLGVTSTPPFARREVAVESNRPSGGYRLVEVFDPEGIEPVAGQFYMLSTAAGWEGPSGRPFLPRAFSVATVESSPEGTRLGFLVDGVGPGTERLARLDPDRDRVFLLGPLGQGFTAPGEFAPGSAGAIIVGGGIGVAPLALLRRRFSALGIPVRVLLGYRDEEHSGGDDLFDCSEIRVASDDGHRGHAGRVTDLLEMLLAGDDSGSAVVYACGPPAMLEAVRTMCDRSRVRSQLALESPMGCGYGACFGCAVPLKGGGYMRLCLEGPVVDGAAIETAAPGETS